MTCTTTRKAVALLAVALVAALAFALTDTATAAETKNTPGALLFIFSSEPVPSGGPRPSVAHVAISLGADR